MWFIGGYLEGKIGGYRRTGLVQRGLNLQGVDESWCIGYDILGCGFGLSLFVVVYQRGRF